MSMFKEFAMPPLVLTVIAAVVTGALVATESVTTPIIEQQAAVPVEPGSREACHEYEKQNGVCCDAGIRYFSAVHQPVSDI